MLRQALWAHKEMPHKVQTLTQEQIRVQLQLDLRLQVGAVPDQFLFAWHILTARPTTPYPSLQA